MEENNKKLIKVKNNNDALSKALDKLIGAFGLRQEIKEGKKKNINKK